MFILEGNNSKERSPYVFGQLTCDEDAIVIQQRKKTMFSASSTWTFVKKMNLNPHLSLHTHLSTHMSTCAHTHTQYTSHSVDWS